MVRNRASSGISAPNPRTLVPVIFVPQLLPLFICSLLLNMFPAVGQVSYYFYATVGTPALYTFSVRRLMAFENTQCDEYLSVVFTECCEGTDKGHPTW